MALPPITDYRMTPPVDSIGDKRLERSRRDFMDLIRSDEERHGSGSQRRNREQQARDQDAQAQDNQRQTRVATDRNRDRMRTVVAAANANQAQQQRLANAPRQETAPRAVPADVAGTNSRNAPQTVNERTAAAAGSARPAGAEAGEVQSGNLQGGNLQRMSPTARAIMGTPVAPVLRRDQEAHDPARPALSARDSSRNTASPRNSDSPRDAAARVAANAVRPMPQDGVGRSGVRPELRPEARPETTAAPASSLVTPVRSRWPEPPAGSSLVATSPAAAALNLVASGPLQQAASMFRLSREVPREVADRISQFLRTGILNRTPFSFPQIATVEARPAEAAAEMGAEGEKPATALSALSSSLMRASLGKLAAKPQTADDLVARQTSVSSAAVKKPVEAPLSRNAPLAARAMPSEALSAQASSAQAVAQTSRDLLLDRDQAQGTAPVRSATPTMLASLGSRDRVETRDRATDSAMVTAATGRGAINPLFGARPSATTRSAGQGDDVVIDLMAGPRSQARRDRIA